MRIKFNYLTNKLKIKTENNEKFEKRIYCTTRFLTVMYIIQSFFEHNGWPTNHVNKITVSPDVIPTFNTNI